MTNERITEISEFLAKDLEGTKALLAMEPTDAAAKLSAEGLEVSADELIAYGEELKKINNEKDGELTEGDLENVAGGIAASTLLLAGIVVGYAMAKGKW